VRPDHRGRQRRPVSRGSLDAALIREPRAKRLWS
jgi:hypothetical protein